MMNGGPASARKFSPVLPALGLAGVLLGGCADVRRAVSLPPIDAESPVAAQVQAAAPLTYVQPRLVDVPPVPKNVLPADRVKVGVLSMVRCRRSVASFAPNHPPLSAGAEQFAVNAREIAQVNPADIPPPDSAARSDAAAAEMRAYAAPPSALASGPPPTPAEAQPATPAAPAPARHAAAPHRSAVARAAPSASPSLAGPPAPAAGAAAVPQVTTADTAPPAPPPRPDPYLERCL
jgi:hypothetical protein